MRLKHLAAPVFAAFLGMAAGSVANVAFAITHETTELRLLMALNGRPTYLGRISATTSAKNNADATAFNIPADARLLKICASAAVRVLPDTDVTEDITTANGVPIAAEKCDWMFIKPDDRYLQAITATSTSDVDVWRLD